VLGDAASRGRPRGLRADVARGADGDLRHRRDAGAAAVVGRGTVVVGPGCLAYGILVSLDRRPALRQVAASYRAILEPIVSALAVPGLAVAGTGDLALDGRKVGGSAQRRGRRTLLHHGTLLYGFDLLLIERYLRQPPREPAYRAGRSHAAFVTNLRLPRERLESAIHAAWPLAVPGSAGDGLPAAPAL
jgi:lipoate---protein ligase